MKEYTTENVRNVVLMGHSGSGKSTLVEAMLFRHKHIDRMGKMEEGTLAADYDPEEAKRQMSLNATLLPVETKTTKLNILDTPGSRDFIGETKACAHAAEGTILVVDATSGIEVGTEFAFDYAEEYELPVAVFVNKLDKENAQYAPIVDAVTEAFGRKAVRLTIPIGAEADLKGVVDIVSMKGIEETLEKATRGDVPGDLTDQAESLREELIEAAAEGDDTLMEKFFEEGSLTDEEVATGLKKAFIERRFIPVFCGAATQGIGLDALESFLENSFPNPMEGRGLTVVEGEEESLYPVDADKPFAAFVFKTVSDDFAGRLTFFKVMSGQMSPSTAIQNHTQGQSEKVAHVLVARGKKQEEVGHINAGDIGVVAKLGHTLTNDTLADPKHVVAFKPTIFPQRPATVAIQAASSKDEDKIGMGLHSLIEQDPTLHLERDSEVRQTLLSGMGDQHLEVACSRLRNKAKVEVELVPQKIRYRETITKNGDGTYRHKKQSGGRGQFAEVFIRLSPAPEGTDYEFKWSVFGGAIPTNFQSAVDKGIQQALERGILAGYRVVGIVADCYDGKHHPVDSSDMAFQIAASQAFQQVAQQSGPIILEPICNVVTTAPEGNMGDVMGDISQRRGKIQGTDNVGNKVIVRAQVPEGELANYAQVLRSITGGRGVYEREFSHYEPVPGDVQKKIIEQAQKQKEEDAS